MTPKHKLHSPEHKCAVAIGVFTEYVPRGYSDISKYQLQFIGFKTFRFAPLVHEKVRLRGMSTYTLGEYLCGMIYDLRKQ